MKPINFPEANKTLRAPSQKSDHQIDELRIFNYRERCISLWKPTLKERLSILLFGRVWLDILSGETQPPVAIVGTRTYLHSEGNAS